MCLLEKSPDEFSFYRMVSTADSALPYRQITLKSGLRLSYIDQGEAAQSILFIHGLATYAGTWVQNIVYLQQHYRCVAIDLPGNGYSEKGDFPYGIPFFAECVLDFIEALGLENVTLCGHSMGGQVAIRAALQSPLQIKKLVLCAPAGFEQFHNYEKVMYRSLIGWLDWMSTDEGSLRNSINSSFYANPKQAEPILNDLLSILRAYPSVQYRHMLDACIGSMLDDTVFDELQDLVQKVLVLFGEADALIPNRFLHPVTTQQIATKALAIIPRGELVMIPLCGHFLQWEQADRVNTEIRQFLQ